VTPDRWQQVKGRFPTKKPISVCGVKRARAPMLDHPHICAIHETSETDGCCFIVMQYVEGVPGGQPVVMAYDKAGSLTTDTYTGGRRSQKRANNTRTSKTLKRPKAS
jgi:hypothetical protein